MKKTSTKCPICGEGNLAYGARAGRVFAYKGFDYPIPSTTKLVECSACHELSMTPAEIEAIEGPIAALHRKRMTSSIDDSLRALERTIPVGQLEHLLHLSQGYLARARSKGEPSFPL